jgi:hypothetical protein
MVKRQVRLDSMVTFLRFKQWQLAKVEYKNWHTLSK